jgi:hypothetical protein
MMDDDDECGAVSGMAGEGNRLGHTYTKLLGFITVGYDITDQLLIKYFAFIRYLRKMGV